MLRTTAGTWESISTCAWFFFWGIFPRLFRAAGKAEGKNRWPLAALIASLAGAAVGNIPEHIWFYPRVFFAWCVVFGLALAKTE